MESKDEVERHLEDISNDLQKKSDERHKEYENRSQKIWSDFARKMESKNNVPMLFVIGTALAGIGAYAIYKWRDRINQEKQNLPAKPELS